MISLLLNGYFQDGLKALVYLVPLLYIIVKRRELKLRYFWLFASGLFLLFGGHLLDFLDEFAALRTMFADEAFQAAQDFFEDVTGFTLGFIIFMLAAYLEFKSLKER